MWTGQDVIVWSGDLNGSGLATGGVAYHPADNTWREIPAGPLAPRMGHSAVWTGSEVVYWGGRSGLGPGGTTLADGAAFNPATNAWRMISGAPIDGRFFHEAVWTGSEMLVWGGLAQCCPLDSIMHDQAAAAYDPASDTWRQLADIPKPWSGGGGTAITLRSDSAVLIWRANRLGRFDVAANTWRDLGSPPNREGGCFSTAGSVARGAILGERFYVWSGGCKPQYGAMFDTHTGTWTALPDAPDTPSNDPTQDPYWNQIFSITAAGNQLLALQGESTKSIASFDPSKRTWSKLTPAAVAPGNGPVVAWTGTELLVWGGFDGPTTLRTGAAYKPA